MDSYIVDTVGCNIEGAAILCVCAGLNLSLRDDDIGKGVSCRSCAIYHLELLREGVAGSSGELYVIVLSCLKLDRQNQIVVTGVCRRITIVCAVVLTPDPCSIIIIVVENYEVIHSIG